MAESVSLSWTLALPNAYRWILYPILFVLGLATMAMAMAAVVLILTYPNLPSLEILTDYRPKVPLRVYTADGYLIGEFGEERRAVVHFQDVPDVMKQAILAAEDERFYQHSGVDAVGIVRAALSNILGGGKRQGASTITQQVAKNFFLSSEKTYARKLYEALLSFKIENNLSKDQIFELYINQIYLGQRAYGFGAAAQIYFGKSLKDLSVAEAAMLAGLPKAPSAFNPVVNPKRARMRQQYVLRRMRELDLDARQIELTNLGMSEVDVATLRDRYLNCGHVLASIELDDPANWAKMIEAVQPPDDYSETSRVLGLYPLAVPAMKAKLQAQHQAALREFEAPLTALPQQHPLKLWSVKPVEDLELIKDAHTIVQRNELGIPNLLFSAWRSLAEFNAPRLWIETADDSDRPAAPALAAGGATADPSQPVVNYQIDFTRFGKSKLVRISYFVWFKATDASATTPLDGFIWRVTLDDALQPLIYESLHASGRDHRWYPAQALKQKPAGDPWRD